MANILLVDDEPNILKLSSLIVKSLGYTVHTAEDGQKALDFLSQHPEIDLVISDLIMPELGGFDLCLRLKDRLRVVIVSAMSNEFKLDKIFETGVLDVVPKPFDINYMRQRLGVLLHALGKTSPYTPVLAATLAGLPIYKGENVLCVGKNSSQLAYTGTVVTFNDPAQFTLEDIMRDLETVGQTVQVRAGGLRIVENIDLENKQNIINVLNKTNYALGDVAGIFFTETVPSPALAKLFDRVI